MSLFVIKNGFPKGYGFINDRSENTSGDFIYYFNEGYLEKIIKLIIMISMLSGVIILKKMIKYYGKYLNTISISI